MTSILAKTLERFCPFNCTDTDTFEPCFHNSRNEHYYSAFQVCFLSQRLLNALTPHVMRTQRLTPTEMAVFSSFSSTFTNFVSDVRFYLDIWRVFRLVRPFLKDASVMDSYASIFKLNWEFKDDAAKNDFYDSLVNVLKRAAKGLKHVEFSLYPSEDYEWTCPPYREALGEMFERAVAFLLHPPLHHPQQQQQQQLESVELRYCSFLWVTTSEVDPGFDFVNPETPKRAMGTEHCLGPFHPLVTAHPSLAVRATAAAGVLELFAQDEDRQDVFVALERGVFLKLIADVVEFAVREQQRQQQQQQQDEVGSSFLNTLVFDSPNTAELMKRNRWCHATESGAQLCGLLGVELEIADEEAFGDVESFVGDDDE